MVLSYPEFFVIYASSLVLATVIGLLVLVGWKDIWLRKILQSARYNAVYLAILAALGPGFAAEGALLRWTEA